MATVIEYINNLKRIQSLIPSEVEKCIKDNEEEIVNLQQDQLYSGERSDGSQITPFYSNNTILIKRSKGRPINRVTLFDEGNFYRGIKTKFFANSQRLDIFSTDYKTKELTDKYGEKIIGLNTENQRYIENLVKDWLEKFIKKRIMIIKNLFQFWLKIYDSPDNMPLSNFIKYLETNDSKYFTKQLKYHKSLEKTVIPNFFKQYEQLTKDKNITERIEKMSEIVFLSVKYDTVNMLVNTARNFSKLMPIEQFKEIISMFEKWDYKISIDKDVFEQLEKINNRIQGIKTKIDMLSSEIKVEDKKESININSTLIDISRVLELKYQLKANELTVSEWIEYKKQAEYEIEERNKKAS